MKVFNFIKKYWYVWFLTIAICVIILILLIPKNSKHNATIRYKGTEYNLISEDKLFVDPDTMIVYFQKENGDLVPLYNEDGSLRSLREKKSIPETTTIFVSETEETTTTKFVPVTTIPDIEYDEDMIEEEETTEEETEELYPIKNKAKYIIPGSLN